MIDLARTGFITGGGIGLAIGAAEAINNYFSPEKKYSSYCHNYLDDSILASLSDIRKGRKPEVSFCKDFVSQCAIAGTIGGVLGAVIYPFVIRPALDAAACFSKIGQVDSCDEADLFKIGMMSLPVIFLVGYRNASYLFCEKKLKNS